MQRTAVFVFLSASMLACEGGSSTPPDPPPARVPQATGSEVATEKSAAPGSSSLATNPLPPASASAAPVASIAPPPGTSAEPLAASAKAPAVASSTPNAAESSAAGGLKGGLPPAPKGILPPGAADKILAPGNKPIVTLLDPGSAPRTSLAYAFRTGGDRLVGVKVTMRIGIAVEGHAVPISPIPRMVMLFGLDVGEPAKGAHPIKLTLQNIALEPRGSAEQEVASGLRPQLDSMKNLGMSYTATPKGRLQDVKLDIPPSVPASGHEMLKGMNQSLESMVVPFPDGPVGVGGQWKVIGRVSSFGADLLQVARYTLKARSGNQVTLDAELVQLAASAAVQSPELPVNVTARIRSFKSEGSGTTQIDLTEPAPISGTTTVKSYMEFEAMEAAAKPGSALEKSGIETTVTAEFFRPAKIESP